VIDAEGRYRVEGIDNLKPEGYTVTAKSASRSVTHRLVLDPHQQEAALDLELPPAFPVHGRVLDFEGEPLEGAQITLDGMVDPRAGTRSDGSFSVKAQTGTYKVKVLHEGYVTEEELEVTVADAPVEGFEIRLQPRGRIRGRILGLEPWHQIWVHAEGPGPSRRELDPEPRGTYDLTGLIPGEWEVTVTAASEISDDYRTLRRRVLLRSTDDARLDFDLQTGPLFLSGHLLDSAKGPARYCLTLVNDKDPGSKYFVGMSPVGAFEFKNLRQGKYRLQVIGLGSPTQKLDAAKVHYEQEVELSADRDLVIDLKDR
jgi:hypothetical protein